MNTRNLTTIIITASSVIFVIFNVNFLVKSLSASSFDLNTGSQLGNFLEGIFSFISVILICITLKHQTDANHKSQFENHFFELLKTHRENSLNLKYRIPYREQELYEEGPRVFIQILRQIIGIIDLITPLLKNVPLEKLYNSSFQHEADREHEVFTERKIDLMRLNIYNIAYLIVFYGVHAEGKRILKAFFDRRYNPEITDTLIAAAEKIPVAWDTCNNPEELEKRIAQNLHYKYYAGHQHRLSTYLRHLYQTVTYVNESKHLSYEEKYGFLKTLRAQMNAYEQAVLFFNSLSELGREWEYNTGKPGVLNAKQRINRQLLTKYNLLKNIPADFIMQIDVKEFYPDIAYEGEAITDNRMKLDRLYI